MLFERGSPLSDFLFCHKMREPLLTSHSFRLSPLLSRVPLRAGPGGPFSTLAKSKFLIEKGGGPKEGEKKPIALKNGGSNVKSSVTILV